MGAKITKQDRSARMATGNQLLMLLRTLTLKQRFYVVLWIGVIVFALVGYSGLAPWHEWMVERATPRLSVLYFIIVAACVLTIPFMHKTRFNITFYFVLVFLYGFWKVAASKLPSVVNYIGPILIGVLLVWEMTLWSKSRDR